MQVISMDGEGDETSKQILSLFVYETQFPELADMIRLELEALGIQRKTYNRLTYWALLNAAGKNVRRDDVVNATDIVSFLKSRGIENPSSPTARQDFFSTLNLGSRFEKALFLAACKAPLYVLETGVDANSLIGGFSSADSQKELMQRVSKLGVVEYFKLVKHFANSEELQTNTIPDTTGGASFTDEDAINRYVERYWDKSSVVEKLVAPRSVKEDNGSPSQETVSVNGQEVIVALRECLPKDEFVKLLFNTLLEEVGAKQLLSKLVPFLP
jgi:hypothetical protein